jgi:hypothetical protein
MLGLIEFDAAAYEAAPYSIAVAAEACVAPATAEAAPNSERPIRTAKMIFRVNLMTGLRRVEWR